MVLNRKQILKELLPGLNAVFDKEYDAFRPITMTTHIKDKTTGYTETKAFKSNEDIENKALIGVPVDTLLGLWYAVFPEGTATVDAVLRVSEDLRDVGRLLRNEGFMQFDKKAWGYYIKEKA